MTSVRLVVAVLLVGSLPALAQTQKNSDSTLTASVSGLIEPATGETWRIPLRLPDVSSSQLQIGQENFQFQSLQSQNVRFPVGTLNANPDYRIFIPADGSPSADYTCLYIRSYVVARDNKDSDSVHPVGYSTCQPSSRYQLKTAQSRSGVPQPVIQP